MKTSEMMKKMATMNDEMEDLKLELRSAVENFNSKESMIQDVQFEYVELSVDVEENNGMLILHTFGENTPIPMAQVIQLRDRINVYLKEFGGEDGS